MKFKVGRLYEVTFLDHSVGMVEMMVIKAVGWCVEDRKENVVFTSWEVQHEDKEMAKDNQEPFSIIKSCIKKKRLLR